MNCVTLNRKALLPALAAVTESAKSLLGPCRSRKQVAHGDDDEDTTPIFTANVSTVLRSLHVQHPIFALLLKTVEAHMTQYGTGATTLVTLVHVFTHAAMDLQHLPPHLVKRGFDHALAHCSAILDRMRMDVQEWQRERNRRHHPGLPPPSSLSLLGSALTSSYALHKLVEWLQLFEGLRSDPDRASSMATAVDIASTLASFDLTWPRHVHFHTTMGPTETRVLHGLFLDITDQVDQRVAEPAASGDSFSSHDLVLVHGDIAFSPSTCRSLESARLVIATGTICARTLDWCRHHRHNHHAIACISDQPLAALLHVSKAFHATVCEDVCERAPASASVKSAVVHASIHALHGRTFLRLEHGARPSNSPLTVLVGAVTATAADETSARIANALHRLALALDDKVVLPGGGAAFAACAASLRRQCRHPVADNEVEATLAAQRFGEALEDWCVVLVLNSASLDDATSNGGYLAAKSKLHDILATFDQGHDDDDDTFLESTFYGAALSPIAAPRGTCQFDGYTSTKAALASAVRVVTLALTIGTVLINQS